MALFSQLRGDLMRPATVAAILATIALLTNGCRNETRRSIRAAKPNLESVPPGNYPKVDLGTDPSNWIWVKKFGRSIEDVIVDPPVDASGPHQLGKDFSGTIEGDSLRINFKSAGVYAVKIVFQDKSIPLEIYLVFVATFEN
jgi:hypothetical protein